MTGKYQNKTDEEMISEIVSILKESELYAELSPEEKEDLLRIVLSA
ncbi:MAG: hypothetical protein JSV21_08875 [Nitrospirota bacterium]|nr:MAG: hypothetical protein JSV21_08875 [Nitrospirota bacterium]